MRNRILSSLFLIGCSLGYSSQLLSQSTHSKPEVQSYKSVTLPAFFSPMLSGDFLFQAGGYWNSQGKSQQINIDGLLGDKFALGKHEHFNGLVGLGYFINGYRTDKVQWSYGANFFYLPKTSVAGIVVQENLFSNLSYNYHSAHYPLYAVAKARTDLPIQRLSLSVDAGLGPNFMRTSGFTERSLDGGITIPDNIFSSHTSTAFSATAGIGLQLAHVFGEMPLECGYRFFYLGQGRFSRTTDQVTNTLHTGSIYANALLCSIRI